MTTRHAMLWSMLWIVLAWVIAVTLPTGVAEGQALEPIGDLGDGPEAVEGVGGIDGGSLESEGRTEAYDPLNPISVLNRASEALPAGRATDASGGASGAEATAGERGGLSTTLSIVLLLSVLSLAPSILVMCTSFTRIIVVLALLRQALGTQTLPPSQVIVGLSLFLTMLVMAPTFERINTEALQPLQDPNSGMTEMEAWERAKQPLRDFMFAQIEHAGNWDAVYMILNYRQIDTSEPGQLRRADVDMLTLIPAFVLSELKVAFLLGFQLYLPFLVIDMVVSSVLISMGMLMLPPVLISLPFKLLLFVMVDGWNLVAGNLLNSFAVPGVTT
ncbi:MAG: flagellar type III secretion system pore protein FliP [Planctomycetota bacterium]